MRKMNEATENKDRFYKPLGELKEQVMLEFAPEPFDLIKIKNQKLSFTVGKKYPLIEKKEYFIKTIDDTEKEVLVNEFYFINEINLSGFEEQPIYQSSNWDIRKLAAEKNVKPLEVLDDDLLKMSGVSVCKNWTDVNTWDCKSGKAYYLSSSPLSTEKLTNSNSIHEGVVKDDGNELMHNYAKCAAAIENVFGQGTIDPDELISSIAEYFSKSELSLKWDENLNHLCVNDVKTKIMYKEVRIAYESLKKIINSKMAKRAISKLIAQQLKKVF
jgi:hypothetical protein